MNSDMNFQPEEEWEASISAMLGQLPPVEPPDGFIASAIDHRPLHAGRTTLGFAALAFGAMALAVGTGGLQGSVVPSVDSLAAQHTSAQAGIIPGFDLVTSSEAAQDLPEVDLPPGFELQSGFKGADLDQAIFESQDREAVSVFHQSGQVEWAQLPAEGLMLIEDTPAWVDPIKNVVVIQAKDEAVTIVGLTSDEVATVVRNVPKPGLVDDITEALNTITSHLGFGT